MSKRWMAGQLSVLLVCALCLAVAWLVGRLPESGQEQGGVTLEESGIHPPSAFLCGEETLGIRALPVPKTAA